MKYLFTFFILSGITIQHARSQDWLWAKSATGNRDDAGKSITTDPWGYVYATGTFTSDSISFGGITLINADSSDIFVVKYDSLGNVLWARSFGANGVDEGNSISADTFGNVFVSGIFSSTMLLFDNDTLASQGGAFVGYDIYVTKLDSSGNVLWAASAGGNGDDFNYATSTDAAGNVFISGTFLGSSISFNTSTVTSAGVFNVYLAKYDPSGNVLWAQGMSSPYGGLCFSCSADAFGNVYLTGNFIAQIDFGNNVSLSESSISQQVFLVKYDPSGNAIWARSGTGSDGTVNVAFCVTNDPCGHYAYITGSYGLGILGNCTITFDDITLTNTNGSSISAAIFIAKYDSSGNVVWAKSAGGDLGLSADVGNSISADAWGNVYLMGSFNYTTVTFDSVTVAAPPGSTDAMFLAKYDANGNVRCAEALSSGGDNLLSSALNSDRFGNAYMTGAFISTPFVIGADSLPLTGQKNVFVSRYFCTDSYDNVLTAALSDTSKLITCHGECEGLATVIVDSLVSVYGCVTYTYSPYTYTWSNGQTAQTATGLCAGDHTVTVTDSAGNTALLGFTVMERDSITAGIFSMNEKCGDDGSITVSALGGTGNLSYLWSSGQTSSAISGLQPGTYTCTVTDSKGCNVLLNATVNPSALPVVSLTAVNAVCGLDNGTATVTLMGGTGNYAYAWSSGDTTATATGLSAGTYLITVSETGLDTTAFWSENFSGGGAGWTLNLSGTGTNGPNANSWVINSNSGCGPCGSGGAYLHITCSGGLTCLSPGSCYYDFITVTGDPSTDKFVSSPDISTVGKTNIMLSFWYESEGDANEDYGLVRLSADGGTTWTDLPVKYSEIASCTKATIDIPPLYEGISTFRIGFRWINDGSSGSGSPFMIDDVQLRMKYPCPPYTDSIAVASSPSTVSSLLTTTPDCLGDTAFSQGTAEATATGGFPPYTYLWSNGENTAEITGLDSGMYLITVTDSAGCAIEDTAMVLLAAPVLPVMSPDTTVSAGTTLVLSADITGVAAWQWNSGQATESITVSPVQNTTYYVTVTDQNSCVVTDSVVVTIKECHISVPTIFSPNADGVNDVIKTFGFGLKEFTLTIYDRWGNIAFETSDKSIAWDGTVNGVPQNAAVFAYTLDGVCTDKNELHDRGSITLVR